SCTNNVITPALQNIYTPNVLVYVTNIAPPCTNCLPPLDHFAWSTVSSPQTTNVPFSVTIVAQNSTNGTVTNFTGTVQLTAAAGPNSTSMTPAISGNFAKGSWAGSIPLFSVGSNVVLRADDGGGHIGLSNPFQVVPAAQPPAITAQPVSQSVRQGTNVT